MKHVFASAGLLALGATALHAYDPEMQRQQTGRPWTVAASVRGFYDDNVNTSPDRSHPQDSFGMEFSPSAHLNLPLEQTYMALGYIYSLRWFEDRDPHDVDQSHEFTGKLRHQFSPRHDIGVDDSFSLSKEPTTSEKGGIITVPTRSTGDLMRNRGAIEDNIGLTRRIGLSLGYVNTWYDYDQEGAGSYSALLDRIEHLIRADFRYQFTPKVIGLIGYTFGISSFTGDDFINENPAATQAQLEAGGLPPLTAYKRAYAKSDERDSYSHFIYVGSEVDLTTRLRWSGRVGAEFVDFHNAGESSTSPYGDTSLSYAYLDGNAVEVGIRHARNATDVVSLDNKGNPTLDAETTAIYMQVNQKITPKLTGSLLFQFQSSSFSDGVNDGDSDDFYLIGVNLEYHINRHFSAEVGYNYDLLCSGVKDGDDIRSYDRNRVYIGLRATY